MRSIKSRRMWREIEKLLDEKQQLYLSAREEFLRGDVDREFFLAIERKCYNYRAGIHAVLAVMGLAACTNLNDKWEVYDPQELNKFN